MGALGTYPLGLTLNGVLDQIFWQSKQKQLYIQPGKGNEYDIQKLLSVALIVCLAHVTFGWPLSSEAHYTDSMSLLLLCDTY